MDAPPIVPPFKPFDTYKPPKPTKFVPPLAGGPGGGGGGGGGGRGFFGHTKVHPIEEDILGRQVQEAPRRKAPQMMHNVELPFSGGGQGKAPKAQKSMMPTNSMFGTSKKGKRKGR